MCDDLFAKIHEIVAQIPEGKVATYGQIADMVGITNGGRTVGWAMRSVSPELGLPCHRVVNKSGRLAPDHIFGGRGTQRRMLELEGVKFEENGCIDMERHCW